MKRKLSEDQVAKNHLMDRSCDTCAHTEYEDDIIETCHRDSGGKFPSHKTFSIPEE